MAAATQEKKPKTPAPGLGVGPLLSQAAAVAQAQNQAPDSIPSMTKPGEFILPPDTVHALGGKAVLQHAVNQTHTPGNADVQVPLGFKPELFFANGGAPEDELKKPNSFGDAAAATSAPSTTVVQTPAPTGPTKAAADPASTQPSQFLSTPEARSGLMNGQTPASSPVVAIPALAPATPPGAPVAGAPAKTGYSYQDNLNDVRADVKSTMDQGNYGEALGKAVSGGVGMILNPAIDAAKAVGGGVADFARGAVGASSSNAAAAPAAPAATRPATPAVSSTTAASPADQQLANGTRAAPGASTTTPATPGTSTAPAASGMVTREGNSYSGANVAGDITINGAAPRNGGVISAQNNQAAENLAAGFRPGMERLAAAAPAPQLGFGPGSVLARQQEAGFTGTIGQQSGNGNMWSRTPEQQRRDAEVQASSIHRPTAALGVGALRAMDAQDLENVRGFNAAQRTAMEQSGANSRSAGNNAADLQRAAMSQSGENYRAGVRGLLDRDRNQVDRERLGMEKEAQGFKTRAAQQQEDLQRVYLDPKSTPEQRAQAQASLFALQGKNPEGRWKAVALQGGTDSQGNKTESMLGAVNEQTGEMKRYGGQGASSGQQPSENHIAALRANPSQAALFDQWYGPGAAKRALGQS